MERILSTLNNQPDNHPETICGALIDNVCGFHECSLLSYDICLLACRWNAPSR